MSGPNTDFDPVEVAALKPEEVEAARDAALAAIAAAADLEALKQVRIDHTGDRSPLALANREIGALPPQARKEAGQRVGQARGAVQQALATRQEELEAEHEQRMLAEETVDVTLPTDRVPDRCPAPAHDRLRADRRHLRRDGLGGRRGSGPRGGVAQLRRPQPRPRPPGTHHAGHVLDRPGRGPPGAAHPHLAGPGAHDAVPPPPIYVICPGRVFRTDEYDATHSPVFHQVEGLVVDEGISMAHLKGTLDHFASAMFGEGITTRFRPSYFPFTEPSAEVDLICFVCRGVNSEDCRTCRGEGWIEWGGCGVVNPRVLHACGIDSGKYSGFAFGMGIDRTLMFRHGIEDLRALFEGDVRFTTAFGAEL